MQRYYYSRLYNSMYTTHYLSLPQVYTLSTFLASLYSPHQKQALHDFSKFLFWIQIENHHTILFLLQSHLQYTFSAKLFLCLLQCTTKLETRLQNDYNFVNKIRTFRLNTDRNISYKRTHFTDFPRFWVSKFDSKLFVGVD